MNPAACFTQPAPPVRRGRRTALSLPVPSEEAVAWLTAHFDWTFGAIWVGAERFDVPVQTIVAWAEKVRAGGAPGRPAGLGTKERTWMLEQLNDPEQWPTPVEMAMARTDFAGRELIPPVGPVRIASVDDAIGLIEARLADDADDRTTRDARELPTLLLDDLPVLRSEQRTHDLDDDERRPEDAMSTDTTTAATAPATAATDQPSPHDNQRDDQSGEQRYPTRAAVCLHCGQPFTARKYSSGWTSYCSQACGAKGRFTHKVSQSVVAPQAKERKPEAPAEPTAAATAESTEPTCLHLTAMPSETSALTGTPVAAVADADDTAAETDAGTPANPSAVANGLAALWNLLTKPPTVQPLPQPLLAPTIAGALASGGTALGGGVALSAASQPTTAVKRAPAASEADDDTLLDAFLSRLPDAKTWTKRERDRWLRAFVAALDLEIETTDDVATHSQSQQGQEA